MCTSIAFRNKNMYFGRNMDIEYSFGERIVTVPRNYEFIPYVLCKYKKVSEVKEGLKDICLSDIPFSDKMPLADLHYAMQKSFIL